MRPALARLAPIGLVAVGALGAAVVWRAVGSSGATASADKTGADRTGDQTSAGPRADKPSADPTRDARGAVRGRVTRDGAPARATVVLWTDASLAGATDERRVDTDADGRFAFADVDGGEVHVTALATGLTAASATVPAGAGDRDVALTLGACRFEIYGAVSDVGGAPLAATVGLVGQRPLVTADADGHYRVCVPGGVQTIEIAATDHGAIGRAVAIDGATRVDAVLGPDARVRGRVVDADGNPVAGALVIGRGTALDRTDAAGTARARSDRDGNYELRGVGPGPSAITVGAPGWIASAAPIVEATPGARQTLALELARPIAVTGTLRAGAAPAARTRLRWRSKSGVDIAAITDDAGGFALAAPPGPGRVVVDGRTVITGELTPGPSLDVALAPASRVSGRVVIGGQPVAGALVAARGPGYATAVTDAAGQFALALEQPGAWQLGASSDERGAAARAIPITVERGRDRDLGAVELAWRGSIAGVVVDEAGAPVVGALVLAKNVDENDFGRSVTGPDGAFRCDQLSGGDGAYELEVVASESSDTPLPMAASTSPRVELTRGDRHVRDLRLTVVAPHARVRGTVVDALGKPRPDVEIRVAGWATDAATATSGADGRFELAVPGGGPYALIATARDGATARIDGVSATAPVRIALAAAAIVHVTASGFANPPAITVRRLGGADFASGAGASFDAVGLAPGTYVVQASAGAASDVRTVTVVDGQRAEVALAARATARVTGRVVIRPDGAPAAGLDCVAAPAYGGIAGFGDGGAVRTDAQGRFALDVPAGDSQVRCWRLDASLADAIAAVHVAAGATATVELPVVRAVDGASLGVAFEVVPEGARITANHPPLRAGDIVTRAGDVALAGLSRTAIGAAAFTARATPLGLTVTRAGASTTIVLPAR